MPALRILLVDDHAGVRAAIRELLAEAFPDARFGEAESIASARWLGSGQLWDVAVVDIHLPDGSGLEIVEDLANPSSPTRIVVVSVTEPAALEARIRATGASFVAKSALATELVPVVRRKLEEP